MNDSAAKSRLGMWVFLGTEVLFFGGLFLSLTIIFFLSPAAFKEGTRHMNMPLGAINTAVLLTSSWTMAVGLYFVDAKKDLKATFLFFLTVALGAVFMVIKAAEYYQHFQEHLIPRWDWHPARDERTPMILFFFLYFFMTLLHAFHLFIGMGLVSLFGWRHAFRGPHQDFSTALENLGLYWHFVDLIWIFLFPCLYLIGRS
jgi:cytochrome c oxidase subunit 3